MTQDSASAMGIAQEALVWIMRHSELGPLFLGATGAAPDALRARAQEPDFLISVLDFLLMDDAWVLAFCEATGHAPDNMMQVRYALPGGENVHWT